MMSRKARTSGAFRMRWQFGSISDGSGLGGIHVDRELCVLVGCDDDDRMGAGYVVDMWQNGQFWG
jgi:hypothetical protein